MIEDRPDPTSGTPTGWVVRTTPESTVGDGAPPNPEPPADFSVYVVCEAG